MGLLGDKHVVRQGDRALHFTKTGEVICYEGPQSLRIWSGRFQNQRKHIANQNQYLIERKTDGTVVHHQGPITLWFHPVYHSSIETADLMTLDHNEILVVYRKGDNGDDGEDSSDEEDDGVEKVTRQLITGPCQHMPTHDEWIHEFSWHGTDPNNKTRKIPNALKFKKLRITPDQMYYNVSEVRTSDDALLTVKLMMFYELKDINRMLDTTHDPIADFVNGVCADVVSFAATLTYEEFLESTSKLNNLSSYSQLVQRAESIGYQITKVVYRGYHASDQLQNMHDSAIQARTKLRLAADTEEQAQRLQDLKLEKEAERQTRRQKMQSDEVRHRNEMSRKEHEEKMRQKTAEEEQKLTVIAEGNKEKLAYIQELSKLNVDMTKYLVSQHAHPDKTIQVLSSSPGNVHVHD